jgi:hypothetical protein
VQVEASRSRPEAPVCTILAAPPGPCPERSRLTRERTQERGTCPGEVLSWVLWQCAALCCTQWLDKALKIGLPSAQEVR